MKKLFKVFLLITLCALFAVCGFACDNCSGANKGDGKTGLLYKKYAGDDYYTVYGYVKEDGVTELDIGNYNVDGVVIGRIKSGAFKDNDSLTAITVPDTVEVIDGGAFAKMRSLTEITIPFVGKTPYADVYLNSTPDEYATKKSTADERVFGYIFGSEEYDYGVPCEQNSKTYYFPQTLRTVNVMPKPGSEYGIPMYAFSGNAWVSTVTLSQDVLSIGEGAFKDNVYAEMLNLSGIEKIYDQAFKSAKHVKIAELAVLNYMGAECFADCSALTTVYVNKDIVADAFNGCDKLTAVTIGSNVVNIGARAFNGCVNLKNVNVEGYNTWTVGNDTGVAFNAENVKNATYSVLSWTRA